MLRTTGLIAGYDRVPVVRGIDVEVHAGEVVALLGANGAGKTTTLLTISGILRAIGGQIEALGESIVGQRPEVIARRGIAHVPEDRALFYALTVEENLRLGARRSPSAVDDALETFPQLVPLLRRKAGLLSGGEQQMLAVGRALAAKPRLLLIDELSLGLAPLIVKQLLATVREIARERGCGVLIVEQHVHLALDTADRAYVLAHGELVLSGDAADLRSDVANVEAKYLGGVDDTPGEPPLSADPKVH